jgi:hypothetical protein
MPLENSDGASDAVAAMKKALSQLETEAGRLKGLSFRPRADDVLVVTSPKSGTTWLQQMVHALRGGGMDFEEICAVVPTIELAHDVGIDLDAEQLPPRAFKTHCWEPHCPKGARYIVCMRDPADVAVSFYHFFEDWLFPRGALGVDEFVAEFVLARGRPASLMQNASCWEHMLSWWPRRHEPDVLLLFFEDLKADLPAQAIRAAPTARAHRRRDGCDGLARRCARWRASSAARPSSPRASRRRRRAAPSRL